MEFLGVARFTSSFCLFVCCFLLFWLPSPSAVRRFVQFDIVIAKSVCSCHVHRLKEYIGSHMHRAAIGVSAERQRIIARLLVKLVVRRLPNFETLRMNRWPVVRAG